MRETERLRAQVGTAVGLTAAVGDRGWRTFERWESMSLSSPVQAQNAPEHPEPLSDGTSAERGITGIWRRAA
jgi:hypothetical protein